MTKYTIFNRAIINLITLWLIHIHDVPRRTPFFLPSVLTMALVWLFEIGVRAAIKTKTASIWLFRVGPAAISFCRNWLTASSTWARNSSFKAESSSASSAVMINLPWGKPPYSDWFLRFQSYGEGFPFFNSSFKFTQTILFTLPTITYFWNQISQS